MKFYFILKMKHGCCQVVCFCISLDFLYMCENELMQVSECLPSQTARFKKFTRTSFKHRCSKEISSSSMI